MGGWAKVKREEVARAEMQPDVYAGPTCDRHRPRWWHVHWGDRDGDHEKVLKLDARHFPPGTVITIEEPLCPNCGEHPQPKHPTPRSGSIYGEKCQCGFDWKNWVEEQYS